MIHRTSSEDEEVKVDKEDNDKEVKTSVDSVVLSDENVDIVTEDVSIINTLESDNGESNGIDINPVSVHDEIEDVRDITVESRWSPHHKPIKYDLIKQLRIGFKCK